MRGVVSLAASGKSNVVVEWITNGGQFTPLRP